MSAAAEYNNNLSELINGFSYDTDSVIDGYDDILNFGDSLIGYIDISKINVKLPIYHGDTDKVLEKVLLICQIQRFLLEVWAIILSCLHIRVINASVFDNLNELEIGDEIKVSVLDETLTYAVTAKTLLSPTTYRYCQLTKKKTY